MRIVFVAGLSGAGKTTCLNTLEDMGYYTASSIPISILISMIPTIMKDNLLERMAFSIDTRVGYDDDQFLQILHGIKDKGGNYEIVFLEASNQVLLERFALSRRRHPFDLDSGLVEAIEKERLILQSLKEIATFIIDTSFLTVKEFKEKIKETLLKTGEAKFEINIMSFGFKYGIPQDADIVLDVRFLPNPYYIEELAPLNGKDPKIKEFIENNAEIEDFWRKTLDYFSYLLPQYIKEGKAVLHLTIGCSGGMHRAVYVGEKMKELLGEKGYFTRIFHRDIGRGKY